MKRCPNCNQLFSDENIFCLNDGTSLLDAPNTGQAPTIFLTPESSPILFVPRQTANTPATSSIPSWLYAVLGAMAAVIIALSATFFITRAPAEKETSKTEPTTKSSESVSNTNQLNTENKTSETENKRREQERIDLEKDKLQLERDKLEREREKFLAEKAKARKSSNQPTNNNTGSSTSKAGAAIVFAPPTNVRELSTGKIICSVTKKRTIRIYGSSDVYDENGVWIYTDVCGTMGVIHSTQIRF